MADYFFSYKKAQETKGNEENKTIEDLLHEITHIIAMEILNELNGESTNVVSRQAKIDLKQILESEVAKLDSIEEVKYLCQYLIDLWRKTHEF